MECRQDGAQPAAAVLLLLPLQSCSLCNPAPSTTIYDPFHYGTQKEDQRSFAFVLSCSAREGAGPAYRGRCEKSVDLFKLQVARVHYEPLGRVCRAIQV
jgi:hypothetical protein